MGRDRFIVAILAVGVMNYGPSTVGRAKRSRDFGGTQQTHFPPLHEPARNQFLKSNTVHYEPAVVGRALAIVDLLVSVRLSLCIAVAVHGHHNRDSEDGRVYLNTCRGSTGVVLIFHACT